MDFANPLVFLLISPVVLGGLYAIRKGVSKYLILSRVIILSLLITALASPFTMGEIKVDEGAPRITVLTDNTMSTDIFNKDAGEKIYNAIKSKTPTTIRKFSGMTSPIGDEIMAASENNNIVLVSDGNSNYGKDLSDAITDVSKTGTRVFAVNLKPQHNDLSVEIMGAKNLIVGNDEKFNIVVRQAGRSASYRLDVSIDDNPVELPDDIRNVVQTEKIKTIEVSLNFNQMRNYNIKAIITPVGEDRFPINNKFYKSVHVGQKPKVLAITDDTGSPLYKTIKELYTVDQGNSVPDDKNIAKYNAVIMDNRGADELNSESLRQYLGNGGGLVVVGGDSAYDKGNYNNSPGEAILPIISRGGKYEGGRNIVIIIDASASNNAGVYGDPITINDIFHEGGYCPDFNKSEYFGNDQANNIICYSYETTIQGLIDANAISIVKYIDGGSSVGVVAFGGNAIEQPLLSMGNERNRRTLEDFITPLGAEGDVSTVIETALQKAENMLKTTSGSKLIVILSDGRLTMNNEVFKITRSLKEQGVEFVLGQISTQYNLQPENKSGEIQSAYKQLADSLKTEVVVYGPTEVICKFQDCISKETKPTVTPTPTPPPELNRQPDIVVLNPNHFITENINLSAKVFGFNNVIAKLGADSLVATNEGNPIITTWGFGLGRVAAFTTDDGSVSNDPNSPWASAVYSGENAKLISRMMSWAIGDPRGKENVVVQAEDIWGGTPGRVTVTSNTEPHLKLDGREITLSGIGPTTYETTINPDREGFYDLSVSGIAYGIAVNYPIEYRDVGFNDELRKIIKSNNGSVYEEDGVEGLLFMDIKEKATRTVEAPQSEKGPFLLAALVLFLAEVIIRRIKDYRKDRPKIEDNPPRAAPETEVVAGEEAVAE